MTKTGRHGVNHAAPSSDSYAHGLCVEHVGINRPEWSEAMENGKQETNGDGRRSKVSVRKAADLMSMGLVDAGIDAGQHPAVFVGVSDTFMLESKFAKGGKETFETHWVVVGRRGPMVVRGLANPPQGPLSPKSNLYLMLQTLAGDDPRLWDGKRNNVNAKATLADFFGRTCSIIVEIDKGGFPKVRSTIAPPPGATFPTQDQVDAAMTAFEPENTPEDHTADSAEEHAEAVIK